MIDVDVNIALNVSHLVADRKEVDPGVPVGGWCGGVARLGVSPDPESLGKA